MDASLVAGWLLVAGSVAFGIGAGDLYLVRAWTAPQQTFLAIVARHPMARRTTHILFIGGTVLTTAGLAVLPSLSPDGWPRALALAGAVAFVIAAVLRMVCLAPLAFGIALLVGSQGRQVGRRPRPWGLRSAARVVVPGPADLVRDR